MKEKESIVKNELIKSEKVMELEDIISKLKMEKEDAFIESETKSKVIDDQKLEIKRLSTALKEN